MRGRTNFRGDSGKIGMVIITVLKELYTVLFFYQIEAQPSSISIGHLHGMMYVIEPIFLATGLQFLLTTTRAKHRGKRRYL
jgi:hypothetical protein